MQFACDKTGFPLVTANDQTLSLLPVTKLQFERFLSEPGGLSSSWYQQILKLSPRCSFWDFSNKTREGLFMTAVTFEEANQFALWLDPSARLPQGREWQNFAKELQAVPFSKTVANHLLQCGLHVAARTLVERLIDFVKPLTLADLALIRDGVIEWVNARPEPGGLGAPRQTFFRNTFDPYHDGPLRHFAGERSPYYGFRILVDEDKR
jgi:hypothetical protein